MLGIKKPLVVRRMRRLSLDQLREAVRLLEEGGVIIFPTETSYGIGCDATNEAAVRKLLSAKGRSPDKGLPIILPTDADPETYVRLSPRAQELVKKYWPGPLNIIAPVATRTPVVALCVRRGEQSVRKSSHPVASELANQLGRPIVASSANPSGSDAPYTSRVIPRIFGKKYGPDAYLDAGVLPFNPASTAVRCEGSQVQVIRQGGIHIPHEI